MNRIGKAWLLFLSIPAYAQTSGIPDSAPVLQLEPLVITAPRLKIRQGVAIDPQINAQLLRLLRDQQDARPTPQDQLDASIGNLINLTTLDGYNLKTRYTQLGFLLTEGLAGTTAPDLAGELENTARQGANVQIRAAAMVALAYTHDLRYLGLFQGALLDQNITVRFGALESLLILGDPSVAMQVAGAARNDQSLPLQIYAAAGMWRMGDIFGREILLRLYQHQDWFVRAMATHYLGELGGADEYRKLQRELAAEAHPIVKAELCSALLRLQQFKDQ